MTLLSGKRFLPISALPAIVLASMVLAAYVPVTTRAGFIWDDDEYVTQNKTLRDASGLWRIWTDPRATPQYYPLVHTTFWIEYHLWGLHPAGYHLVNVVLHAASAVLLWRALRELRVPGAWFAAAIFAIHPVHVESVAWVTERKNVLSGALYLAALLAYLSFAGIRRDSGQAESPRAPDARFYWLSLALFVAALLSKTVAASLPAALLLLLWWKRDRLRWSDVLPLAPLLAIGVAMGLLTAWLEHDHVGAHGAEFAFTFAERCLIAGRAVWFYAGKLLWPRDLAFIYPRWTLDVANPWQWLYPVSAVCLPVILWLARGRLGKGPLVAVLYFGGTVLPALGFINIYPMVFSFVADHFQYLASIGLIALFAAAATVFLERTCRVLAAGLAGRVVVVALGAAYLLALASQTWQQGWMYENSEVLWRATLASNPDGWMPNLSYAVALDARAAHAEALVHYRKALRADPKNPLILLPLATNLAAQGRYEEAVRHNQLAMHTGASHFDAMAHLQLADIFQATGDPDRAVEHLHQATRVDPSSSLAHFKLGLELLGQDKQDQGLAAMYEALKLEPDADEVHLIIGAALQRRGDLTGAARHFYRATQIRSDDAVAHGSLAVVLLALGQVDAAEEAFRRAVECDPGNTSALGNLAMLTAERGNVAEAIQLFERAISAEPNDPQLRVKLAYTLDRAGQSAPAAIQLREALQLAQQAGDSTLAAAIIEQLAQVESQAPQDDARPRAD